MDFAIVGMECVLPGSPDAESWINATTPALREVPRDRWPARTLENPTPGTPDRTVSRVGGWLDDANGLFTWSEQVIGSVLDQARVKPERTHLLLANLSLPTPGAIAALDMERRPAFLRIKGLPNASSAPAQHAADFFRLGQTTCLDAACASGLYSVRLAMEALRSGSCDAAIAAGVQACDPSYLLVGFSQLLALSPAGLPRPLDRRADGLVVGEGAAAVLLKRLPDALLAGDRIHGVIRDGGLGNDGRKGNMLSPDSRGQIRAMRSGWSRAGLDPRELGYVECHATGTVLGDSTELRSLRALLEEAGPIGTPVAVSSAKALIGHTITVAGLAGLIRATGAVRDGFIPAGPEQPLDVLVASTHLRTASAREAWPSDVPRRAAVSAFGFGGTNAHVVVDGPPVALKVPAQAPAAPRGTFGLRAGLRRLLDREPEQPEPPQQIPAAPSPAVLVQVPRLAVVGLAGQLGTWRQEALFEALRNGRQLLDARGRLPIPAVLVDPRRWRIPPLELADLQPQQLLALEIGADALETSGIKSRRVGVIMGLELDPNVCEHVVRWATDSPDRAPALDAPHVQGQLPNFLANRLSAQCDLEGPSYTVSAGDASGWVALQQAAWLLAQGELDAVVLGAAEAAGEVQGALAMVVTRVVEGQEPLAFIDFPSSAPARSSGRTVSAGCLTGLLQVFEALLGEEPVTLSRPLGHQELPLAVEPRQGVLAALEPRKRVLSVPNPRKHAAPSLFGSDVPSVVLQGEVRLPSDAVAWPHWRKPTGSTMAPTPVVATALSRPHTPPPASAPTPEVATPVAQVADADTLQQLDGLEALVGALVHSNEAVTRAHAAFMQTQYAATRQIAEVGLMLQGVDPSHDFAMKNLTFPEDFELQEPTGPDELFDHAALIRHAEGRLSEVFGPSVAHLDRYDRRTRMPAPPMLLCSRVVALEGTPGNLGPARIVTEYDLPTDASWSTHDGKPNACVIVESGQADLFLVSWLGIEEHCKGERVYRLLDCDLTFHGVRPEVGETLRHDIRIKSFARLGGKILFYFEYDCTSNLDGRAVLTMRNGVAGFFTPAELARPQGLDPVPTPLAAVPTPVSPRLQTSVRSLDEIGVQALVDGRFSEAFGPGFEPADGSALTLPDSEWRLVHRIEDVQTSGGPYGLGLARYEQVLRDDDWFNPCHFVFDPCMPGTLMLEGCLQAVQVWLLATGIAADHPHALFEPLPDLAFELRCRGQVVPGHSSLVYEARIKEACLDGIPYAIADVLLSVDGVPVVLARNVGVTLGARKGHALVPFTADEPAVVEEPPAVVDVRRLYEYSIGDAERAFGSQYADYAGLSPRCARMPGPPLLQMTRVLAAENAFVVKKGESVTIAYDVPPNAWYFATRPGDSMPFAILLETALQPCGWLTAWQAAGIKDGRDLYFRNLGGEATQHQEVWPDSGTLVTTTTQTVVAQSAGLLIHNFALEVTCKGAPVYSCTTSFGYFSAAALDAQKGLGLADEDRRSAARRAKSLPAVDLAHHKSMPREDWRNLDRVTVLDSSGGKSSLGFYEAEKIIDPTEWFFTAHFFLDPVMPGSLGLEAALQLARFVFELRTGRKERLTPIRLNVPHRWKYRGQVRRPVQRMSIELEVTALTDDTIVFNAVLRADGVAIYELMDFGLTATTARVASAPRRLPGPTRAALLDSFEVHADHGTGHLRLDPARFPWLADHCPTVTAPALPMAFAAEIAAEAATLLRPGLKVVGVPQLEAEQWIHTGEGPIDVLVVAVVEDDRVAVSLAVHVDNPRFPKLSGPKVHMRAVVELATHWPQAPAIDRTELGRPVGMSVEAYYEGGLTFHGPSLQGMIDLGTRGPQAARAVFHTRADASLNGPGPAFVLDPLLLDTATHPMMSGEPEIWDPSIGPGKLAYPISASDLRLYGPRPVGEVECVLRKVDSPPGLLSFDVALIGVKGVWSTFRWSEALVPGGPVLGHPTAVRKAFIWDREAVPEVQVGHRRGERFRVSRTDLVEPIEGTLVGLFCTERERQDYLASPDRTAWTLARLAAKGAARAWLSDRLRDVHPADLELLDLRPDRMIVVNTTSLSAQEWIDHLGPTRFHLVVEAHDDHAEAWLEPTGWPT